MKYCSHCGERMEDGRAVCPRCGASATASPTSETPDRKEGDPVNALCVAGFVCSFFFAVVGLVLSIVGFYQTKGGSNSTNRGLSIAGIVISAVSLSGVFIAFVAVIVAVIVGVLSLPYAFL